MATCLVATEEPVGIALDGPDEIPVLVGAQGAQQGHAVGELRHLSSSSYSSFSSSYCSSFGFSCTFNSFSLTPSAPFLLSPPCQLHRHLPTLGELDSSHLNFAGLVRCSLKLSNVAKTSPPAHLDPVQLAVDVPEDEEGGGEVQGDHRVVVRGPQVDHLGGNKIK